MAALRLVVFDVDGVLADTNTVHEDAFDAALAEHGVVVGGAERAAVVGLPTKVRLERLGVPLLRRVHVDAAKQRRASAGLAGLTFDGELVAMFDWLRADGYVVGVASNSRRSNVDSVLTALGLDGLVDHVLCGDDVERPKPNPEMYLRVMVAAGVGPKETLIVEDSLTGRQAAYASGARVLVVENRAGLTEKKLRRALRGEVRPPRVAQPELTVVVPMAGAGARFEKAGFTFPKPLVDVAGRPMIQCVVDNLAIDARYVFVVRRDHRERYALDHLLNLIAPGCVVLDVAGTTEGAACSVLLARDLIGDGPLLISNSDHWLEWRPEGFLYFVGHDTDLAGAIPTFHATHPKWSFVATDVAGYVTEVAEKQPISDQATCGLYWWRHGTDFVRFAEEMIAKDVRVGGEFYVAPVYNQAIAAGLAFRPWFVNEGYWGLGTPEDLQAFLAREVRP